VYENAIKVMRFHARKLSLVATSREREKSQGKGCGGGVAAERERIYNEITKHERNYNIYELCLEETSINVL
jgi:hypothetical protein